MSILPFTDFSEENVKNLHRLKNRIQIETDQFIRRDFGIRARPTCICGTCEYTNIPKLKKDIAIIYSRGTSQLVSIQMRLVQTAGHLKYMSPGLKVRGYCLQSSDIYKIVNSNIILTKFAVENISSYDLKTLSKNNTIFADVIDLSVDSHKLKQMHKVIASSNTQYNYFKNQNLKNIDLIYQTTDFRIRDIRAQNNKFSIAYFGSMPRIPSDLLEIQELSIINTPLAYEAFRNIPIYAWNLTAYSAHLAVGTKVSNLVFKPFTKGLIASSVGAITLISKENSEAISLLGKDYPYVAVSNSKKSVEEAIDFMRSTFLGKEWRMAQASHRKLLKYCCEVGALKLWAKILTYEK